MGSMGQGSDFKGFLGRMGSSIGESALLAWMRDIICEVVWPCVSLEPPGIE